MVFTKAHKKRLLAAGSLAVAVTVCTVTGCGGGTAAALVPGSAPGQWTQAEVSQLTAAAGGGSGSQGSCSIRYVERDMSFENAMAAVSVDPASGPSMSAAQIRAALVSKYGSAKGDTINAQFEKAATDSGSDCGGAAAASTSPAAPAASGESEWLPQVHGALQNVQQDLSSISADTSSDPSDLALDGSELEGDAQAALDPNDDPPPADNADWVTAINDYVTAGEDYSGDNMNEQDDNPAQAGQEIAQGNLALARFNAANGGVLNGTIP